MRLCDMVPTHRQLYFTPTSTLISFNQVLLLASLLQSNLSNCLREFSYYNFVTFPISLMLATDLAQRS
jgi:hypothetical protein